MGELQRKTSEALNGRILLTLSLMTNPKDSHGFMLECGVLKMQLCFKRDKEFSKEGHVPLGEAFVICIALSNVIV